MKLYFLIFYCSSPVGQYLIKPQACTNNLGTSHTNNPPKLPENISFLSLFLFHFKRPAYPHSVHSHTLTPLRLSNTLLSC
jgi:hypothetical protein